MTKGAEKGRARPGGPQGKSKAEASDSGAPRVIVVVKRSNLMRLEQGQMDVRARQLVASGHLAVKKWRPAHEEHVRTLEVVEEALSKAGATSIFLHGSYAEFDARGAHLVITVGGDGTLLAASHWIGDVPILGVNSAPRYSVGFFCGARGRTAARAIRGALEGELEKATLSRMAVSINGQERSRRVLNEALFCHVAPAATSNYVLSVGGKHEEQKSSGLWVGPPAGSTGALRSAGGRVLPLTSRRLQMIVREPFSSGSKAYRLVREVVSEHGSVTVMSKMQSASVYLDGPYRELGVRLGDEVRFTLSDEPLTVLGLSTSRRS